MKNHKQILSAALAALLCAAAPPALAAEPSAPQISLLTIGPGEIYWQRYGHNALVVRDGFASRVYNYGMFDFRQKNFFLNFARGRMLYQLAVQPYAESLTFYRAEGRWVREQTLNLKPEQARALADFLAWNARPENADYRYDYFHDNCSTRVRDAVDRALGGGLRAQLEAQPTAVSYRDEANRLMAPDPLLALGADVLLGRSTDPALNRWQQSFVPMELMDAVRGARNGDAPLLLVETSPVALTDPTPSSPPPYALVLAVAGLVFAVALLLMPATPFAVLTFTLSALGGLFGLVLLLGWSLTDHAVMAGNINPLLFSPLSLALLACWRRPVVRQRLGLLILLSTVVALPLAWFVGQSGVWLGFWLPIHAVLAWRLRRTMD